MRGLPLALLLSAVLWSVIIVALDAATGWPLAGAVGVEFAAAD